MPTYIVRIAPDRIVLRTTSKNSASALYRNIVKAARRGQGRLPTNTITLEADDQILARHCPELGLPAVMPMMETTACAA